MTTFRQDVGYSDGRHPDRVTFSSPEEDAQRRDFTINGMFYDPLEERVIDFVGGQEDLRAEALFAPSAMRGSDSPKTSCACCGLFDSRRSSVFSSKLRR